MRMVLARLFEKRIHVNDAVGGIDALQRRDRLAGEAELGIVIVLDDITVFALRGPIEKRVTPCDGRDDARREVVRR